TPSNLKPGPTIPFVNDAPFNKLPLFVPCTSFAVLSPDHQLTRPDGGGAHPWVVTGVCKRIETVLSLKFVTATSILPSRSKSALTTPKGFDPVAKEIGVWNVASPLPSSIESALEELITAKSSLPSPFKSARSDLVAPAPIA